MTGLSEVARKMQTGVVIMDILVALTLIAAAEYLYMTLRSDTRKFAQETRHIPIPDKQSLEIVSDTLPSNDSAPGLSFRIATCRAGGYVWIIIYVVLWNLAGLFLMKALSPPRVGYLSLHSWLWLFAYIRGFIAVGRLDNARTDRKYRLQGIVIHHDDDEDDYENNQLSPID